MYKLLHVLICPIIQLYSSTAAAAESIKISLDCARNSLYCSISVHRQNICEKAITSIKTFRFVKHSNRHMFLKHLMLKMIMIIIITIITIKLVIQSGKASNSLKPLNQKSVWTFISQVNFVRLQGSNFIQIKFKLSIKRKFYGPVPKKITLNTRLRKRYPYVVTFKDEVVHFDKGIYCVFDSG